MVEMMLIVLLGWAQKLYRRHSQTLHKQVIDAEVKENFRGVRKAQARNSISKKKTIVRLARTLFGSRRGAALGVSVSGDKKCPGIIVSV